MSPSPARKNESPAAEVMSEKELKKAFPGTDVVKSQNIPEYDSAALVAIETWDDVAALLESTGVVVEFADKVLGDGFGILSTDDKASLIGKPMMLLEWRFNNGDQGEFVSIRAIVKTGDMATDIKKLIINDGSTGIREQLKKFTVQTGKQSGLLVRRGLRVSEYTYEDPSTGVMRPAKTYYIDASA